MEILEIYLLAMISIFRFKEVAASASWSYSGGQGPSNWASLDTAYQSCGLNSQSPIDITGATTDTSLGGFTLNGPYTYYGTHIVENTGHSLKVTIDTAYRLTVTGGSLPGTFRVTQFHFHWGSVNTQGSEHTLNGVRYPMELHFDAYNSDAFTNINDAQSEIQRLGVFGFFFEIGSTDNAYYSQLLATFPSVLYKSQTTSLTSFDLIRLLPTEFTENSPYYRYFGSLTTPPCNESVIWTVFQKTIKISNSQLAMFRILFSDAGFTRLQDNFRPIQSLNSRTIKYSGSPINQSANLLIIMMFILTVLILYTAK